MHIAAVTALEVFSLWQAADPLFQRPMLWPIEPVPSLGTALVMAETMAAESEERLGGQFENGNP